MSVINTHLNTSFQIMLLSSTNTLIHSAVFQFRYFELLNMVDAEWGVVGGSNHSSTKENTLICIRAGQALVTYNSAGFHITHRDCYSAFSTIHSHMSSIFSSVSLFLPLLLVLYSFFCLVQITIIASKSCHCLEAVCSAHLVIFSLIIPFLPLLSSVHSPFVACCRFSFFNPVCCFSM